MLILWIGILVILNISTLGLMNADKKLAKTRRRRIPESRFFVLALLGGAAGAIIGMRLYRHKTKHPTFTLGMPVLLAMNIVMYFYLITYIQ